ncbi:hypothetical protein [Flavobacterium sp.]|uniref:hypothetical protein n=1 Tax=Flavobacterium sp. TaxID=239 RepID=UPI00286CC9FC|nr:hypothetical protein [Flavobacterium sp.]
MIRIFPNEEFKEISLGSLMKKRYALSNKGRLASFTNNLDDGDILNGGNSDGYVVLRYRELLADGQPKNRVLFIYKSIAELFIPKTSEDQKYVIHIDYVRNHDDVKNLRWVTYEEKIAHYKRSPKVIRAKQDLLEHNIKSDGRKLSVTNVIRIKKMMKNPKGITRKSIIAKQFGISATHLNRILSGENWGHIVV